MSIAIKTHCTIQFPEHPSVLLILLFHPTGTLREELVASGIINITKELSKHEDQKVQEAASSLLAFIIEMQIDR